MEIPCDIIEITKDEIIIHPRDEPAWKFESTIEDLLSIFIRRDEVSMDNFEFRVRLKSKFFL